MKYRLVSRGRRATFLFALGLCGAILGGEALRVSIATELGESLDLHRLQAALALDPANPQLHRRLGQIYLFVLDDLDAAEAARHFRRATELNPHLPSSWTDLGRACDLLRNTVCADGAFEQALTLNPMSPDLRWVVANHYLLTHRSDAALPHFRRLLELSPRYALQTFALCLRALKDPEVVWQRVLPEAGKDPKLDLAFVNFLSAQGRADDAYQIWAQVAIKTLRLEFPLARPYLDDLVDQGRYREATQVWRDLERLGVIPPPRAEDADNLIYNGNFERAPLNSGLDWHFKKEPYLMADFSDPAAYQGHRCLRLEFTVGRNEEHEPVYQIVPLLSNQKYLLSAYVRSEDITSDSGPRLRVLDPGCSGCLDLSSEMTVGTTGWHRVTLTFETGAQTRFVRLSLWRPRARRFPAEIAGTFWADAVSLEALNSGPQRTAWERGPEPISPNHADRPDSSFRAGR